MACSGMMQPSTADDDRRCLQQLLATARGRHEEGTSGLVPASSSMLEKLGKSGRYTFHTIGDGDCTVSSTKKVAQAGCNPLARKRAAQMREGREEKWEAERQQRHLASTPDDHLPSSLTTHSSLTHSLLIPPSIAIQQ